MGFAEDAELLSQVRPFSNRGFAVRPPHAGDISQHGITLGLGVEVRKQNLACLDIPPYPARQERYQ